MKGVLSGLLLGNLLAWPSSLTLLHVIDCDEIDRIVSQHSLTPDERQDDN